MPEPIALIESNIDYLEGYSFDDYVCEEEQEEEEILIDQTTPSYKCLVLPEISRSSIFFDKYYYFPEIEDPELELALWGSGFFLNFNKHFYKYISICFF